ncbi:MAG: DUF1827 domain-containing protein [Enterococcus sp.]
MKLIETPVNNNLNLANFYPNITNYLIGDKAIKYYKLFVLDRTQIIYVDLFDSVLLVLINTKKKISKQEVDSAIQRVLHTTREHVSIRVGVRREMEAKGITFAEKRKDIIVVEQKIEK